MFRYIFFLNFLFLLSCQTYSSNENEVVEGNTSLKTSDGVLDLSLFSQEQQKIEREQAAKRLEELKAGRVILEADDNENIRMKSVNLAVFARSVSNKVGEKLYYRNFLGIDTNPGCKKFSNKNEAQIFFLKNGGPENDFHNIDIDGDGFACNWDPAIYRKIKLSSETKFESN